MTDPLPRFCKRLGSAIQTARKHKNMSQAELAERLELSATFVGYVERGKRMLSLEKLVDVVQELDISLDPLFRPGKSAGTWNAEAAALIARIPEEKRDIVMAMLRAAAGVT